MTNKKVLLILVLVFAVLLVGASVLYNQLSQRVDMDQLATQGPPATEPTESEETEETRPNRKMAPDFTVYDAEGNKVRLSDYFGKPIVLNFWASWCGPCQMEMPEFQEKYLEYGAEVQFLMVNVWDAKEEGAKYIQSKGYTFPVFYDTDSQAAAVYGIYSIPTTFFIDAEGNAVAQATGAINAELLQKGIGMILP